MLPTANHQSYLSKEERMWHEVPLFCLLFFCLSTRLMELVHSNKLSPSFCFHNLESIFNSFGHLSHEPWKHFCPQASLQTGSINRNIFLHHNIWETIFVPKGKQNFAELLNCWDIQICLRFKWLHRCLQCTICVTCCVSIYQHLTE